MTSRGHWHCSPQRHGVWTPDTSPARTIASKRSNMTSSSKRIVWAAGGTAPSAFDAIAPAIARGGGARSLRGDQVRPHLTPATPAIHTGEPADGEVVSSSARYVARLRGGSRSSRWVVVG